MDNKTLTTKNKVIKKHRRRSKHDKPKTIANEGQFLNDNLVDLISNSYSQQQPQQNAQILRQGEERVEACQLKKQSNIRVLEIAKERFAFVLKVDQHYKIKVQHQQLNKTTIQPYFNDQEMQINGRNYSTYQPSQQFIVTIARQNGQKRKEQLKKLQTTKTFKQFIKKIDLNAQTLLCANRLLSFQECLPPWSNLPYCIEGNDSVMIIGQKNTGKSALSEYLMNQKDCALLDCDIGRNSALQGCISLNLSSPQITKKIWIGELTPLNNLQTYLRAIAHLFKYYTQTHYTKKLIINTMGYTTGLGQFLLYEIYNLIKPKSLLVLSSGGRSEAVKQIVRTIKRGEYVQRLYLSKLGEVHPSSTNVFGFENVHATTKRGVSRFQKFFQIAERKVNHFTDLIALVSQSQGLALSSVEALKFIGRRDLPVFQQSRHKKQDLDGVQIVSFRKLEHWQSVDMRLIVLGRMVNDSNDTEPGLFEVQGLGFGYNDSIYSTLDMQNLSGVASEGIDFEKGFYHLNEKQLIDLELRFGRMSYVMAMAKGLGSKGMRNNPSKVL